MASWTRRLPARTALFCGLAAVTVLVTGCPGDSAGPSLSDGSQPIPLDGASTLPGAGGRSLSVEQARSLLAPLGLATEDFVVLLREAVRTGRELNAISKDERNRRASVTAGLDPRDPNVLHLKALRRGDCEACGGTGRRDSPDWLPVSFECKVCDGSGLGPAKLESHRFFLDGSAPATGSFPDPFAQTQEEVSPTLQLYLDKLGSTSPTERLAACRWLDAKYFRQGKLFTQVDPGLRRARYSERSGDMGLTVYQFWAGKGEPRLADRAYYRVYINNTSGSITRTGFFPEE